MNDKMREALELVASQSQLCLDNPKIRLDEDTCDKIRDALTTPPTEQTGRVIATVILDNGGGDYSTDYKDLEVDADELEKLPVGTKLYTAPAISLPSRQEIDLAYRGGCDSVWNQLENPHESDVSTLAKAHDSGVDTVYALLTDRLGKPVEVDLSRWAKTQGFDGWAADHAAVLRNLKAYLKAEGVRVKE